MKKTVSCIVLCFLLLLQLPASAGGAAAGGDDEFHYAERDAKTTAYWYKSLDIYEGEAARKAEVPFGYEGRVMKLTGDSAIGFTVDFTELHIPVTSVKALHMRVYYTEKQREVRVTVDAGVSWVLRHEAKKPGEWEDVVIGDRASLQKLADGDGRLGVFGFGFRCHDGTANSAVYVDEIRAELYDDDKTPPVIKYDGPEHITTSEGKLFTLDVSAYDESEKAEFPVSFIWSGEALDKEGRLTAGEYDLTLESTDSYGNRAEKKLRVTVGEKDTVPPVIHFGADVINTVAGAHVSLAFSATDDCDAVSVEAEWSEDAVDRQGRITEGEHTLTLTSEDLSGNKTEKTVKVSAKSTLR